MNGEGRENREKEKMFHECVLGRRDERNGLAQAFLQDRIIVLMNDVVYLLNSKFYFVMTRSLLRFLK